MAFNRHQSRTTMTLEDRLQCCLIVYPLKYDCSYSRRQIIQFSCLYIYHSGIAVIYQKTDYRVFSKYMHHSKNVVIVEERLQSCLIQASQQECSNTTRQINISSFLISKCKFSKCKIVDLGCILLPKMPREGKKL